eukprot:TRINITY_DN16109_c0_g1_i1.p1 TRINITY_DN16109_c0_g1~~TRINITY_DN16109_c0_g1_i1.p1  ORF type:complete len:140 (-),score=8.01 TRINITY_DN16109_c0_g1_i1:166-585(-)
MQNVCTKFFHGSQLPRVFQSWTTTSTSLLQKTVDFASLRFKSCQKPKHYKPKTKSAFVKRWFVRPSGKMACHPSHLGGKTAGVKERSFEKLMYKHLIVNSRYDLRRPLPRLAEPVLDAPKSSSAASASSQAPSVAAIKS